MRQPHERLPTSDLNDDGSATKSHLWFFETSAKVSIWLKRCLTCCLRADVCKWLMLMLMMRVLKIAVERYPVCIFFLYMHKLF